MESILQNSVRPEGRGIAEIMDATTFIGTIDEVTGQPHKFTETSVLLLAFNHLNEALCRLRSNQITHGHHNVSASIEKGLRRCRKWHVDTPEHVIQYIVETANIFHRGAAKSFLETLRKYVKVIKPAWGKFMNGSSDWKMFKELHHVSGDAALPDSGPGSYAALFWGWVMERYPTEFGGVHQLSIDTR